MTQPTALFEVNGGGQPVALPALFVHPLQSFCRPANSAKARNETQSTDAADRPNHTTLWRRHNGVKEFESRPKFSRRVHIAGDRAEPIWSELAVRSSEHVQN